MKTVRREQETTEVPQVQVRNAALWGHRQGYDAAYTAAAGAGEWREGWARRRARSGEGEGGGLVKSAASALKQPERVPVECGVRVGVGGKR